MCPDDQRRARAQRNSAPAWRAEPSAQKPTEQQVNPQSGLWRRLRLGRCDGRVVTRQRRINDRRQRHARGRVERQRRHDGRIGGAAGREAVGAGLRLGCRGVVARLGLWRHVHHHAVVHRAHLVLSRQRPGVGTERARGGTCDEREDQQRGEARGTAEGLEHGGEPPILTDNVQPRLAMRRFLPLLFLFSVAPLATAQTIPVTKADRPVALSAPEASGADDPVVLVIHGGAGTITKANMTDAQEASLRASLEAALRAGHAEITAGRPALDAVVSAIHLMEEDPQFNSGRGGVFAADGTVRHDASIMDGATGMAGASSNTQHVRHPISLARAVMENSPHVLLTASGAEEFALQQGLEMVSNTYFHTASRRAALDRVQSREREAMGANDSPLAPEASGEGAPAWIAPEDWQMKGTVGAVALDNDGHLAAGTSTGGMTNKRWGRVGDSPIIGAGTYAMDATCGVSATGHGEYFIRLAIAHDIAARAKYLGETCAQAARHVIMTTLTEAGGTGGVIVLDARGEAGMPFNTEGMYRGTITRSGAVVTAMYGE